MAGVKGKSGRKANERPFRLALGEILNEIDPSSDRKKLYAVARRLVDQALDGDTQAIREVMDRVDGKPKQVSEVSGPDGGSIPHSLTVKFE